MPSAVLFAESVDPTSALDSPAFVILQTLGGAGPSLVAIVLVRRLYGKEKLRELLGRFKVWRVGWRWYLVSILLVPSIAGASVGVRALRASVEGETFVLPAGSPLGEIVDI